MTASARDAILDRVRQALKRPAPEPHWLHEPRDDGPMFPARQTAAARCVSSACSVSWWNFRSTHTSWLDEFRAWKASRR